MTTPSLLETALIYARGGWPVFPIRPREKRPLTAHGLKDATCDPAQVSAWWRAEPKANVAIRTGARPDGAGLVVLDVDGAEGESSLPALGELAGTLEQRTGSGEGRQLFFTLAAGQRGLQSAKRLGPGLDTRGEGGYVLMPPSIHPSGGVYAWSQLVVPALAPAILLERPRSAPAPLRLRRAPMDSHPEEMAGLCRFVATRPPGKRNDVLNWAAHRAGRLIADGLDRHVAEESLTKAAIHAYGADADAREIDATIRSGLEAGIVDGPEPAIPLLRPRLAPCLARG